MRPALSTVGAAAAVVVAGAVVWGVASSRAPASATPSPSTPAPLPPVARPVAAPVPAPAAATSPAAPRTGCSFTPGQTLAYALDSRSSAGLPGASLLGAQGVQLDARLEGTLALQVLRPSTDGAVLVGHLEGLRVTAVGVTAADLAPPFLVEIGRDCRLLQFARAQAATRAAARNQQALLWTAAFALSGFGDFEGQDGTGSYAGRLALADDGVHVQRTIAQYRQVWSSTTRDVPAQGFLTVTPGAGPWFEGLQSRHRFSLDGTPSTSSLDLTRVAVTGAPLGDVDEAAFLWENLLPQGARTPAKRPFTRYDRERQARVAPLSLDDALSQFDARTAGTKGLQDTWPDLSAWFEVHPDGVAPAVAKLRSNQMAVQSIAPFYTALGKARVKEAREALLAIRRDANEPPMDRVRATFNLLDREDVGVELSKELAAEAVADLGTLPHKESFLRGEAALALGMMGGLRGDAQLSAVARETFTHMLKAGGPDSAAGHSALKGIGNTGDTTLLPVVVPATTSGDFHTRIAAAHVFRRMPPQASEALALDWLKREDNPFVKRELYTVIRRQHFDALVPASEAMTRQAMADLPNTRSPIDRKTIIRFIAHGSLAKDPDFRRFLVAQAKYERQKDSGILNEFTDVLTPAEVEEVLR